jgi:hypothetical protein
VQDAVLHEVRADALRPHGITFARCMTGEESFRRGMPCRQRFQRKGRGVERKNRAAFRI